MTFHHRHHHQNNQKKTNKAVPDDGIGGDQLVDPSSSSSSRHGRVTTISSHSHSSSSSSSSSTSTLKTLVLTPPPSSLSSLSSSRRRGKKNWNKQPPKKRRLKQRQHEEENHHQQQQQQHENQRFGVSSRSKFLLPLQTNLTAAASTADFGVGVGVGVGVPASSSYSSSFNNNNSNNNAQSLPNMVRQAMMNLEAAAAAAATQVLEEEQEEEEEENNDNDFSSSSCFVPQVVSPSRRCRLGQRQEIWWKIETKEQQQLFDQQMVQLGGWIEQIQSDNDTFLASHPYLQKKTEKEGTKKTTSSIGQQQKQQQQQQRQSLSSSFSWTSSSPSFCKMLLEGSSSSTAQEMSTEEAESFSLSPIPLHGHHHHHQQQRQQQQRQKDNSISQLDPSVLGHQSNSINDDNSRIILENLSENSPSLSSLLGDDDNDGIVITNMSTKNDNGKDKDNVRGRDQEMVEVDTTTTATRLLGSFQLQDAIGTPTGVFGKNRRGSNRNSKRSSHFDDVSVPVSTPINNGLTVPFLLSTNPIMMPSDSTASDKYHDNSELYHHRHHRQRRSSPKYRDGNHPPLYPTVLEFDQAAEDDINNDFEASFRDGSRRDITTSVVRKEYNGDPLLHQNNCNDGETSTNVDTVKSKNMNIDTVDRAAFDPSRSDGRMTQPVSMNRSSSVNESMTLSTSSCQQKISRTLFPHTEKKGSAPKTSKKMMNTAGEGDMKWPVVTSTLASSSSSSSSHDGRITGPDQRESSTKNFDESTVVELPPRSQKNYRPSSSSQGISEPQLAPRLLRKKSSIQSTASNGTTSSCASNGSVCVTPTPKELKFVEVNSNPFGELDTYMDTQLAKDHVRFLSQRSGVSQNSTNNEHDDDSDFFRRQMLIGRGDDMTKDARLPLPRTKIIAPRTSGRLDESSDMMMVDQEPVYSAQSRIHQDDRFKLLCDSKQTMNPSSSVEASPINHEDSLKPTTENMCHQGPDFYRDLQIEQLKTIAATNMFDRRNQEIAVKQALGVINIPPFPERNFAFYTKQKATTRDVQAKLRKCNDAKKPNDDGDRNNARSYRSSELTPIQEASDKDNMTTEDLTPKTEKSLLKTPPSNGTESSDKNVSVEHRLQPKQRRSPNSKSQEIAYRAAMAAGFLSSGNSSSFLSSRQSFSEHQEELNYKASVMDLGEMSNEGAGSSTLRRNRSEGYFQVDSPSNELLHRHNNKAPRRVSGFTER